VDRRVISYHCGRHEFTIHAPSEMSARLAAFYVTDAPEQSDGYRLPEDIPCETATSHHGTSIKITPGLCPGLIERDRRYPYDRLERRKTLAGSSFSYFRYNTHVRDVEYRMPRLYEVRSFVRGDENAALIPLKDSLQHDLQPNEVLLHASCVVLGDNGLLVVSNSGGGKTVATASLLASGCAFVGDETLLVSVRPNGTLTATYVPQAVYARLSLVSRSPLAKYLLTPEACLATQIADEDSIREVVMSGDLTDKIGLTVAPRVFCECFGASRRATCEIRRIVILERVMYARSLEVRPLDHQEGLRVTFSQQQAQRYLRTWYPRSVRPHALARMRLSSVLHVRHGGDLLSHDELGRVLTDSLG